MLGAGARCRGRGEAAGQEALRQHHRGEREWGADTAQWVGRTVQGVKLVARRPLEERSAFSWGGALPARHAAGSGQAARDRLQQPPHIARAPQAATRAASGRPSISFDSSLAAWPPTAGCSGVRGVSSSVEHRSSRA